MNPSVPQPYKELYQEYQRLSTLQEKLAFWNSGKLPLNYIQFQECTDWETLVDLHPFALHYELPQCEWERLNLWMLESYELLSTSPDKERQLLDLGALKASFELALRAQRCKRTYVLEEQSGVEASFVAVPYQWHCKATDSAFKRLHYQNSRYKAEYKAYLDYKQAKRLPDYAQCKPYLVSVLKKANGVTLAQYWSYLSDLATAIEATSDRTTNEVVLNN